MAGIGFELRKLLGQHRLSSVITAFGYSYILGSGSIIVSIISIVCTDLVYHRFLGDLVRQFQIVVTHIVAYSLILSGIFQLLFTRYVADRLFEKEEEKIIPNLNGVLSVVSLLVFIFGFSYSILFLQSLSSYFSIVFIATLVVTGMNWILNVVHSGSKNYRWIFFSFVIAYSLTFILAYPLGKLLKLEGIVLSFSIGQTVLFILLYSRISIEYPYKRFIDFEFLSKKKSFYSLSVMGFFYNFAIWIDKFIFWYYPLTGEQVVGPFNASVVYDIPVFLAYLSITPGIAAMTLMLEAYFSADYEDYYGLIFEQGTLGKFYEKAVEMAYSIRDVVLYVLLVQVFFNALIISYAEDIFSLVNLSFVYISLFKIYLVGTTLQLLFISILAVLSYYDRREEMAYLTVLYFFLNALLSVITIFLGPYYYGYGFVLSTFIVLIYGMIYLRNFLGRIHYETFMLRR